MSEVQGTILSIYNDPEFLEQLNDLNEAVSVEFVSAAGDRAISEAERMSRLADSLSLQMQNQAALADRFAAKALATGDLARSALYSRLSVDIREIASGSAERANEVRTRAQLTAFIGDIARRSPIGEFLDLLEINDAISAGE